MAQACRDEIKKLWQEYSLPGGANASLIRDRYLLFDVKDKVKVKDKENTRFTNAKKGLYDSMRLALGRAGKPYALANQRYMDSLGSGITQEIFETAGLLVIGLGSENVLETGLTLHHTYGTPVIPGSALKGLASHYCDQVWGTRPGFKRGQEYHEILFGTGDNSGHIIFYDAWITPESLSQSLKRDIMTPHHGDYYAGKDVAPTDFDEPNPISFLSLSGSFHIAMSCDTPDPEGKWTRLAFRILSDALREWGIGGKTSAGYGRMVKRERQSSPYIPSGQIQMTTGGSPHSAGPASGGIGPMFRKGQIVQVTRVPDPHPRPGRERQYFRAPDGYGGFSDSGTKIDIAMNESVELEILGVQGSDGYIFILPGTKKQFPARSPPTGRQDYGRPQRH